MQLKKSEAAPGVGKQRDRRIWGRRIVSLVLAALIFSVGVGVGDGRIYFHHNSRSTVATGLPNKLDYSSVNQVYQALKDNYDGKLTASQLEDGLKHGLAQATNDPYTVYFTAKEASDFNSELNNSFSGIGAQLGQDSDKNLEVISPIAGLPADKAGLKAQDIITTINGGSTTGMSVDDAVNKIRGPKGSKVTLQVIRDKSQTLTFTITRNNINLPSVNTKILAGNVGYMQLTDFANDTAGLAQKAADQFKQQNVKGIILDLRSNGGGYLDAGVKVSSLWLNPGQKILDEKRGNTVVDSYTALGGDELHGIPTVILVDGGTASAAEITAGALHDNNDAHIIGEKTYGKGVVQKLINLCKQPVPYGKTCNGDAGQLKVTVASWYRPDGQNINHKGITPDQTVKISDADQAAGNDTQLQAAQAYLAAHQ